MAGARHPETKTVEVTPSDKMRAIDDFMLEEIMSDSSQAPHRADDFKGDNEHLVCCIDALLDFDDGKALVPHGLGGKGAHAYRLLCAARHRLASQSLSTDEEVRRLREAMKHIELISTNHGGWFESDAWAWGQRMGSIARAALQSKDTPSHGG